MSFLKKMCSSRKFMLSLGTMITVMANQVFGLDLSAETIQNLIMTLGIYVGGQGVVDLGLALKGKYNS